MIPIIKKLQKRFEFPKPIVVADAGLLSKENIRDLEKDGYEYITAQGYVRKASSSRTR